MKIRSIDKDIKDILESGFYRIPRFQRPYSWDRENIEDFWNDVIINADADYFIGGIHYILAKIDRQHAAGITLDYQQMNIEHLSALNPGNGIADRQAGNIGNLILTEPKFNQKLGSKPFAQKIAMLRQSKIFLDPTLEAATTQWGSKEISLRAKWLSKNAYEKIWKV